MGEFDRPFLGSAATADGELSVRQLRMDFYRIHRDVYVRKGVELDARARAYAAALWALDDGILAGLSAAAMHGSKWIDADSPAELFRTGSRRSAAGIRVHADSLESDEFEPICGLLASTPARTAFDLGRRRPFDTAVARLDALCRATDLKVSEVGQLADRHRGARGIVQLRNVLELVDPGAESPQETRTRLEMIRGDLPIPSTQIQIRDTFGQVVARADIGWERWKVIVEYEGTQHWLDERQRTRDIERYEQLDRLGWAVIRVNAQQLRQPHTIVSRARVALRAAGAPV
ncbi:DUF559 domain-containing protein [Antrihabitans cavernicola]|uniref:DUF559 domain-containing protein n=1 Tax=Antrihabitans cavernicola TaxID=2495913 RepID=A0A5A7SCY3_9NOCA|nr:DUF559 domain-containing protein [Spelaeibacter cavernicola]KAA0023766.1 DUF559 domain-containing protein [Spelaeibacter cavernicola]